MSLLSNLRVGPHKYCKEISFFGKTTSFTSTPDYLGVLTRSQFALVAQTTKKTSQLMSFFANQASITLDRRVPPLARRCAVVER
jgi:hypothetical protein